MTYLVNVVVLADGNTDDSTVTVDDVYNTWWEAGFVGEFSHEESGKRGEL